MNPFTAIPLLVFAVFGLTAVMILFAIIKGITQWSHNNTQPVLTTDAQVITKRQHILGGGRHSSASTSYYATFEFASGEHREFRLSSDEFAVLAERDSGQLTYQGTRYHRFVRRVGGPAVSSSPPLPQTTVRTCASCGSRIPPDSLKCPGCGSTPRSASSPTIEA